MKAPTPPREEGHSQLGGSGCSRWMACPGSVRLSRAARPSLPSPYALEGTKAHEIAAAVLRTGRWPSDVPSDMKEAVEVYVEHVGKVALASSSGTVLAVEQSFDLGRLHAGARGTVDALVYDSHSKHLTVWDYKHGSGVVVEADGNRQLLYYALGACLAHPTWAVDVLDLVIVQPRAPHPQGPVRIWRTFGYRLLEWWADLEGAMAATDAPDAPLNPGDHCRFCPAAGSCPALRDRAMLTAKQEFSAVTLEAALDGEAEKLGRALDAVPQIEAWIEGVKALAHAELERGSPVPGWKLVAKRATRRWRENGDAFRAAQNLAAKLGVGASDLLAPAELLSPAQVEKALPKDRRGLLEPLVLKESTGTTLAPERDPRPPVQPTLPAAEFSVVESEQCQIGTESEAVKP